MYVMFWLYLYIFFFFFFFNDTATTEIYTGWYTLSLHDALPIYRLDRLPALAQRAAHARRAHHGPAGRLAGVGHQPALPPLQPPHPGVDGRHHAGRQGEPRGSA